MASITVPGGPVNWRFPVVTQVSNAIAIMTPIAAEV